MQADSKPCLAEWDSTYRWLWKRVLQIFITNETFRDTDYIRPCCCCRHQSWPAAAVARFFPGDDRDQTSRIETQEPLRFIVKLVKCDLVEFERCTGLQT